MKIDVITIFPELFSSFLDCSIVARARGNGIIDVDLHDLREHTSDRHKTVDDTPYGGGPGMVMKPEPWFAALRKVIRSEPEKEFKREIIQLTPKGEPLKQQILESLSQNDQLVMLCGRYEEIDDRVRQQWQPREISLGDFVINGGELGAQVIIEGVTRLLPGAISDPASAEQDSFSTGLLDHRHYTKPREFEGLAVPEVLLSGDHEKIRLWRLEDALKATWQRRPDLLDKYELSREEQRILDKIDRENSR
jgi:tRNA (guanine37-N1)-methyltransferase